MNRSLLLVEVRTGGERGGVGVGRGGGGRGVVMC